MPPEAVASLHTERLLLRPFTLDDAEAYQPLVRLPEVLRYLDEQPLDSLDAVRELLRSRPLRDYELHGFGRLACIEKSSGRLIGFCGLKFLDQLNEIDLGYRFLPACWGKGYASESAQAVLDFGRNDLGLDRIIGLVMPGNAASARVLVKLGMRREGNLRPDAGAQTLDLYVWHLAKDD